MQVDSNNNNISIVAIVTTYNPDHSLIRSINSYSPYVDNILIWKNSNIEKDLEIYIINNFEQKCKFLGNCSNVGVGTALNAMLNEAEIENATHILTMDQDSFFIGSSAKNLLDRACSNDEQLIVYSPSHVINGIPPSERNSSNPSWVMTSGNLFSTSLMRKIGIFREDYFIDGIDIEWCARLKKHGGNIIILTDAMLEHQLGDATHNLLFGIKKILSTNHSPFRYYYIFRNYFSIIFSKESLSLVFRIKVAKVLFQIFLSIIFFENKKTYKIRYALQGIHDYIRKRYGAINRQV